MNSCFCWQIQGKNLSYLFHCHVTTIEVNRLTSLYKSVIIIVDAYYHKNRHQHNLFKFKIVYWFRPDRCPFIKSFPLPAVVALKPVQESIEQSLRLGYGSFKINKK